MIVTTPQLAKELKLSPWQIRRLVRDVAIPALPLGRHLQFDREQVLAHLREQAARDVNRSAQL
jgi:excisionase family DNA binding protein